MTPSRLSDLRRRVLLVDDEPHVTDSLRLGLRGAPFEILCAHSAAQALEILEREPADVVVSDEQMPGMPGSELLTRIRERFPDTIRIILTGQASVDATINAINHAAVFRFLTKPCHPEELRECLESAFRAKSDLELARSAPGDRERRLVDVGLSTLWMAFQPIVSADSRTIYGYEALLRTDTAGIGPVELIGAAEALGRVADLEARIRERIAVELATAPDGVSIFVNLHPTSLADPGFFEADNPLHPFSRAIVLEVTERASLEGIVDLPEKIGTLRDLGYRIALDDLGAGYAGLTSFATLKPDIVKFDLTLIRDIDRSPTRQKLVASMSALCREMSIACVAEGIESGAERDTSSRLGCRLLQGFFLGRPAKPFPDMHWNGGHVEQPSNNP